MASSLLIGFFGIFLVLNQPSNIIIYGVMIGIPGYIAYTILLEFMQPAEMVKAALGFALLATVIYVTGFFLLIILVFSIFGGPF